MALIRRTQSAIRRGLQRALAAHAGLPEVMHGRSSGAVRSFALYGETVREMKKVTWPTWKETKWTTIMVFVIVTLTVIFFWIVDAVLFWGQRLLVVGTAG